MKGMPRLLSLPEIAEILNLPIKAVRRFLDENRIRVLKVAGSQRVLERDLMNWLSKTAASAAHK
jgi:excisionase family DNA binding protein